MYALDILRDARTKLNDRDHWTTREFAQAADGRNVLSNDPRATCWCAVGALYSAANLEQGEATNASVKAEDILTRAVVELFPDRTKGAMGVVPNFNDHRLTTHEDVLAVYDRAILIAENE